MQRGGGARRGGGGVDEAAAAGAASGKRHVRPRILKDRRHLARVTRQNEGAVAPQWVYGHRQLGEQHLRGLIQHDKVEEGGVRAGDPPYLVRPAAGVVVVDGQSVEHTFHPGQLLGGRAHQHARLAQWRAVACPPAVRVDVRQLERRHDVRGAQQEAVRWVHLVVDHLHTLLPALGVMDEADHAQVAPQRLVVGTARLVHPRAYGEAVGAGVLACLRPIVGWDLRHQPLALEQQVVDGLVRDGGDEYAELAALDLGSHQEAADQHREEVRLARPWRAPHELQPRRRADVKGDALLRRRHRPKPVQQVAQEGLPPPLVVFGSRATATATAAATAAAAAVWARAAWARTRGRCHRPTSRPQRPITPPPLCRPLQELKEERRAGRRVKGPARVLCEAASHLAARVVDKARREDVRRAHLERERRGGERPLRAVEGGLAASLRVLE